MASFVLAFESTHAAMAAQKGFAAAGLGFCLIPTPREISAGCGMSLKFEATSASALPELADDVRAAAALYEMTPDGAKRVG